MRVGTFSPDRAAGSRRNCGIVLIASLFLTLPALGRLHDHLTVWRGLFLTATIGALTVVCTFIVRLLEYRHTIRAGGDPSFYLRNGGLLHHWMIFAVVEAMVFGALLEYRATYPRDRGWTTPELLIHGVAIICSLTRGLWFACLVLIAIHLVSHRPKSAWFLLGIPSLALLMMFTPVRQRVEESLQPDYSSNMERIQMVRVGWRMIRRHPLAGVGAGRVEKLYPSYLEPGELLPAYHGHLHNNPLQLAAEFGLPVLLSAVLFVIALWRNLWTALRRATRSSEIFLARAALLGVVGFLVTGLTDYTYGHSLGLILFIYVSLAPLHWSIPDSHLPSSKGPDHGFCNGNEVLREELLFTRARPASRTGGGRFIQFLLCGKPVEHAIDLFPKQVLVGEVHHRRPILRRERVAMLRVVDP